MNNNDQVLFILPRKITKEIHHQVKRKYGTDTFLSFESNTVMIVCELKSMPNIVSAHYYITVTIKMYFQVRTWGHFKKIAENRLGGDMNTISLYEPPHHFTEYSVNENMGSSQWICQNEEFKYDQVAFFKP